MNASINDAINAFNLLREHVNENGFLHECYNLGISALKTIQDGNYKIDEKSIPNEVLDEIINYNCRCEDCNDCKYFYEGHCLYSDAKAVKNQEVYRRRVKEWINKTSKN